MTEVRPIWRPMAPADLPALLAVADIVHPSYPEDAAVFEERLALFPAGCLVLELPSTNLIGYILSHPWTYAAPPALNSLLRALPMPPTTYYIHDIALLPEARGTGAANAVVAQLIELAQTLHLPNLSLVAVNNSVAFWQRHGFVLTAIPALDAKLRSYDEAARFMVRAID
ncbi:MAG TPA: GNAT family N-acetyltransferase [Alphaproteobacteria bacterium]|jgi:ribosomal protein S18 acetylase RimI-like enzyme|nr:GNAT family N-acetyltransferase [Alphaproteobacteria bacterium]